jgi:hypothetical protein
MEVALYARVSTSQQQHEGTIESQRRTLQHHIQHHGWSLLPEHESIDDGISGARLDRPALDRLRDAARRGEFDAVVILSPDRLARNYAHQWLLIEEFEKMPSQPEPYGSSRRLSRRRAACHAASRTGERLGWFRWRGGGNRVGVRRRWKRPLDFPYSHIDCVANVHVPAHRRDQSG